MTGDNNDSNEGAARQPGTDASQARALTDELVYDSYAGFVNRAYPSFLRKFGLERTGARAEGAVITDSGGKAYIDCVGGYGVANAGHNDPVLIQALIDQLHEQSPGAKPFITGLPVRLAEVLAALTGGDLSCSFLCNSGSEAIDNALKLARLSTGRKQIIAARGSFHGYTCGALSVSGIAPFRRLFEPLIPGIDHVSFGDIEELEKTVSIKTAAVLLEPMQHEAGVVLPPAGYFAAVRRLCDEHGVLLIVDEVKTGIGKTGRLLACEHFGITPDMIVLGKSLGGGLIPVGALLSRESLWKKFGLSFPMSASSYAGNSLACRAAIETIALLRQRDLVSACAEKGEKLLSGLRSAVTAYPALLKRASGLGLLIGLETAGPAVGTELSREMIRNGVLALPAFGNGSVLMFEPPLVISANQIEDIMSALHCSAAVLSEKAKAQYADM